VSTVSFVEPAIHGVPLDEKRVEVPVTADADQYADMDNEEFNA